MKFAVLQFPGSNCDQDALHVVTEVMGQEGFFVWHGSADLNGADVVIVPGGFSYGDYLRCGAIARISPVMAAVKKHAASGGLVLGICNGFQILCEAGLLPGALLRNRDLHFICKHAHVRCETPTSPFTSEIRTGAALRIPIAHGEGNYFADATTLRALEDQDRVLFRYCDARGRLNDESNPNGSAHHIAGICNEDRNVLGMMPHPERASEKPLGSEDGRGIFESLLAAAARR